MDTNFLRSAKLLCPGFCGRVLVNASRSPNEYSECQACPWGTRALDSYDCRPCHNQLTSYDYSYLVFHAVTPLFVNTIFIRLYSKTIQNRSKRSRETPFFWQLLQILCALLESTLALLFSFLAFEPYGHLKLNGCRKGRISEWYPFLYNPIVDNGLVLKCSSEVVYPLYSLPFLIYIISLLNLIVFRSILHGIAQRCRRSISAAPFYAQLWTLPIMGLINGVMSGLLYYSFAHLTVFAALVSNAVHLATEGRKGILALLKTLLTSSERLLIVIVDIGIFGFGVFALYFQPPPTTWQAWLGFAVTLPLPLVFYCITVRLTEPSKPRIRR
ncbi:unnamed protein product [Bursaphelenchus xylophilus]|uniref:(pine wood nematode) hypothetical protein n=1 Tax=Bursaphelenchus xylophilus TaxID=6326 RepID=A0A1I7S8C3_BURXY|nr:unnamed protein product [Bursaphelenchus xylophilus]CAG9120944.1 unnamed protein product [Bursaphelenchus xylophilus]